jgi:YHS domain-containing protein
MRAAFFLVWLAAALILLIPFFRRSSLPGTRPAALRDELVKDPICQTYVVRSRAVRQEDADGAHYFCSPECARRYTAGV